MINKEPSIEEMAALWQIALEFIHNNDIRYEEDIHEDERVIENSYFLIEMICDNVGYKEDEE